MKKVFVLMAVTFTCTFLFAQESNSKFSLSIFGSPTIAHRILSTRGVNPGFISESLTGEGVKPGYSAGLLAGYKIHPKITLQTGISFSNNGYVEKKRNLNFAISGPTAFYTYKAVYRLNYIDIPLRMKYTFFQKKKVSLYAIAGLEANFNMSNKRTSITWFDGEKNKQTSDYEVYGDAAFRKVNFSTVVGLGIDYAVSSKVSLFAEFNYRQMLLPMVSNAFVDRRPYSFGLTLGVRINF